MSQDSSADDGSRLNEEGHSASMPQSESSEQAEKAEESSGQPHSEKSSDADSMEQRRKKAPPVDRTKLDVDAVRDMASSAKAEQDAKLREELESRPVQPFKQLQAIENYRKASPCSSVCKTGEKLEIVTSCDRCNLRVYDFKEMEQPEADELVFKMEGLRNVLLYKRRDGKFLTEDCPVGLKARQTRAILTTGAAAFFIAVISLSFMMPKPAPQPVPVAIVKKAELSSDALSKQSTTVKSSRGWMARTATQGTGPVKSKKPVSPMSQEYAAWGGLDPNTAFSPPAQGEAGFVQPAGGGVVEPPNPAPQQSPAGSSSAPPTGSQPAPNQAPSGATPDGAR